PSRSLSASSLARGYSTGRSMTKGGTGRFRSVESTERAGRPEPGYFAADEATLRGRRSAALTRRGAGRRSRDPTCALRRQRPPVRDVERPARLLGRRRRPGAALRRGAPGGGHAPGRDGDARGRARAGIRADLPAGREGGLLAVF